ncbi:MAG: hypothetical protein WC001_03845 [Desulfurivibrionaceae bacterium]
MAQAFIKTMVALVTLISFVVPAYLWITKPAYLHSLDVMDSIKPFENPLAGTGKIIQPVDLLKSDQELRELKRQLAGLETKGGE